jgi:hypothetical protein
MSDVDEHAGPPPVDSDTAAGAPPKVFKSSDADLVLRVLDVMSNGQMALRSQAHLLALANTQFVMYAQNQERLAMMYISHTDKLTLSSTFTIEFFCIKSTAKNMIKEDTKLVSEIKAVVRASAKRSGIEYTDGESDYGIIGHRFKSVPLHTLGDLLAKEGIQRFGQGAPAVYVAAARMDKIDTKMFGEQYRLSTRTGAIIYPVLGIRTPLPLPKLLYEIYSYNANIRTIPAKIFMDVTNNNTEDVVTRYGLKTEEDLHRHLKQEALEKAVAEAKAAKAIKDLKTASPHLSDAEHARQHAKDEASAYQSALTPWRRLVMGFFINYKPKTTEMTFDYDTLGSAATGMDNATSGFRGPKSTVDVYVGAGGRRHASRR